MNKNIFNNIFKLFLGPIRWYSQNQSFIKFDKGISHAKIEPKTTKAWLDTVFSVYCVAVW
jgi:hypothetical protein